MKAVAKGEHYLLVAIWAVLPVAAKGAIYRQHRKALTQAKAQGLSQRFAGLSH